MYIGVPPYYNVGVPPYYNVGIPPYYNVGVPPYYNVGVPPYLAATSGDGTVSFWKYSYKSDKLKRPVFDSEPTRYHEKMRPGTTILNHKTERKILFLCVHFLLRKINQ